MTPLQTVYWLRVALGTIAAFVCTGFSLVTDKIPHNPPQGAFPVDWGLLMNGLTLAMLIYLISYYALKNRYVTKVQKPQKILTTGIGIYFIAWLVFWTLLYTILAGPPLLT